MEGVDVRTVHLVRDSRAVAHSWTRQKRLPSPIAGQESMSRFRPAVTAAKWLAWNAAFHAISARGMPYLRMHYEAFVADPGRAVRQLSEFAGEPLVLPEAELAGRSVTLGPHHIFSGNPMRAATGPVRISLDDAWKERLPGAEFAKVTALTWPLLRAYGYRAGRAPDP
jgi:hypothetical protein